MGYTEQEGRSDVDQRAEIRIPPGAFRCVFYIQRWQGQIVFGKLSWWPSGEGIRRPRVRVGGQAGAITVVQAEKSQTWARMTQVRLGRHRWSMALQKQVGLGVGFIMCYFPISILSMESKPRKQG